MSEVSPIGTVENGADPMEKQEILTQEMPPEPQLQLVGTGSFHEGPGIPANCGDDNYDNNSLEVDPTQIDPGGKRRGFGREIQ